MKNLQLLMTEAGEEGNRVGLARENDEEGQASEGHPSGTSGERRALAEGE